MASNYKTEVNNLLKKRYPDKISEMFDKDDIVHDSFFAEHLKSRWQKSGDTSIEKYILQHGLKESAREYIYTIDLFTVGRFLSELVVSDNSQVIFEELFTKTILYEDLKLCGRIYSFNSTVWDRLDTLIESNIRNTDTNSSFSDEKLYKMAELLVTTSTLPKSLVALDETYHSIKFEKPSYVSVPHDNLVLALKWKLISKYRFKSHFEGFYDTNVVQKILKSNLNLNFSLMDFDLAENDYNGQFLLERSLKAKDFVSARMLLERGAKIKEGYWQDLESLKLLEKPDYQDFVKQNSGLLLKRGLDLLKLLEIHSNAINSIDKIQSDSVDITLAKLITSAEFAEFYQSLKPEILKTVLEKSLKNSLKVMDDVSNLLNGGQDGIKMEYGRIPLEYYIYNGNYEVAKILLEKGASASLLNSKYFQDTAEFIKFIKDNLTLLIKNGYDPKINIYNALKWGVVDAAFLLENKIVIKDYSQINEIVKTFSDTDILSLVDGKLVELDSNFAWQLMEHKKDQVIISMIDKDLIAPGSSIESNLFFSCKSTEVLQKLIERGIFDRIDKTDFLDSKLLQSQYYSKNESLELIELLIKPFFTELTQKTTLSLLANGNLEFLQFALELGLDFSQAIKINGGDSLTLDNTSYVTYPVHIAALSDNINNLDRLKFMEANGADLTVLDILNLSVLSYYLSRQSFEKVIQDIVVYANNSLSRVVDYLVFEHGVTPSKLDLLLLKTHPNHAEINGNAKKLLDSVSFSEPIFLPKNVSYNEVIFSQLMKFQAVEYIYASHFYAVHNKIAELKASIENDKIDINAKDSSGKTALFYAQNMETVKFLVEAGADVNLTDNEGNSCLHTVVDLDVIAYLLEKGAKTDGPNLEGKRWFDNKNILTLVDKGLLKDWQQIPGILNTVLQKDSLLQVNKIQKQGGKLEFQLKKDLVESIKKGTLTSTEVNKYQALIATCKKMGVELPSFLAKYVNDPKDYSSPKEMQVILSDVFLNALVDKYLETFQFEDHGLCYNDSVLYIKQFGQLVSLIENDIAKEILIFNNLEPKAIEQEYFVYRGLTVPNATEFIDHNELFGHKALIKNHPQNFVFHAVEEWNKTPYSSYGWEFAGVYMSFSKEMASGFAGGGATTSTLSGGQGILMTIKVGPNIVFTCGRNVFESEIISLSTIPVESIKSFTLPGTGEVIKNPFYVESALDYHPIQAQAEMIATFDKFGCKEYVKANVESMDDYEAFEKSFKSEELIAHRAEVYAKEVCPA